MQRRKRKIRHFASERPVQRLAEIRKAPILAGLARQNSTEFDPYDWVVETIWTKLRAPHADIEPVSNTRAGNGVFCCRDSGPNWPPSP
jgi:hypothetical protein